MKTARSLGFTLIELLTVIAIIAILAGLVAAGLPRVLERARLADVTTDFNGLRTALSTYLTANNTYPPAYGFRTGHSVRLERQGADADIYLNVNDPLMFVFTPYMASIGEYGGEGLYDLFGTSDFDANRNMMVDPLEFSPNRQTNAPVAFPGPLYGFANGIMSVPVFQTVDDLAGILDNTGRPYFYIPVNRELYGKFKRIIDREFDTQNGGVWDGEVWPQNMEPYFANNYMPPTLVTPQYTGFVLVSAGPEENENGVVSPTNPITFYNSLPNAYKREYYQALALRAYYMATRDLNNNGVLDFDFIGRSRRNEAQNLRNFAIEQWGPNSAAARLYPKLPRVLAADPQSDAPGTAGPLIFVGE